MLPLSLLEFACFEAAFSECLQFSEQSGRNCIEVAYRSVWHIQEKAGLPNDDIVIIWRDSLSVDFPNGGSRVFNRYFPAVAQNEINMDFHRLQ